MGLDLITYKQVDRQRSTLSAPAARSRARTSSISASTWSRWRAPAFRIIDGLRDMRDSIENPRFRDVLTVMTEDMEGGKVLSQCMATHPEVFDNVFVSLVRAGEQSGQLPEVFKNLADNLKWQDELISQTRRLLILPAHDAGGRARRADGAADRSSCRRSRSCSRPWASPCPMQTRVLIAVSDFMTQYWLRGVRTFRSWRSWC